MTAAEARLTLRGPESRPERRDREQTRRIADAALRLVGGHPHRGMAAARLRIQAGEYLEGALAALHAGAGDERVQQLLDAASRRLRAAADVGGRR